MVMTADDTPASAAALAEDFCRRWPDLPGPSTLKEEGLTLSFNVGAHAVILGNMPAPIPWTDLEGPCATSYLWRNASQEVKLHRFHYIVTVLAELDPVALSGFLTRAVGSTLAVLPGAIGVYWGNGPLVIPREIFLEFATTVLPHGPPIPIWVDLRVWREKGGRTAGFTSGLKALGCSEIEVPSAPEKPSELYDRLLALSAYVALNPTAIQDGHTVGQDATERIRVSYKPSKFGRADTVMVLTYENARQKRWWKV
jgi:hypothetical protein